MKVKLLYIGKTGEQALSQLLDKYEKRIKALASFEKEEIPALKNTKNLSVAEQKNKEGELLLKRIKTSDFVVLLDEKGKTFDSREFAGFLQQKMNSGIKQLLFIIGGPYGFSPAIYRRGDFRLSLSEMTFSHQLIRLIFMEQLYRAFTIIHHHPYHND